MLRPSLLPVRVGLIALAVRVAFVLRHPVMPYGDSYGRAVEPAQLVKSVWLPGYQLTLAAASLFNPDLAAYRAITVVEGAVAAAMVAWLGQRLWGVWGGRIAGMVVAIYPTFVLSSSALYQESLFLALAAGACIAYERRGLLASALLLAACLTRYEGWILSGFFAAGWVKQRRWRLAAGAWLGPLAWVAFAHGITPMGTASLNLAFSLHRLAEHAAAFAQLFVEYRALFLLLCGLVGLGYGGKKAWILLAFALAYVLVLVATDPYTGGANPRELHIPLVVLALLAGGVANRHPLQPGERRVPALLPAMALVGLVAPILSSLAQAPAKYAHGTEMIAAGVGKAVATGLPKGTRILVLANGVEAFPQAESDECTAVRAWTGRSGASVRCDSDADLSAPNAPDFVPDVIVRIGLFRSWRPWQLASEADFVGADPQLAREKLRFAREDLRIWSVEGVDIRAMQAAAATLPAVSPRKSCGAAWLPEDRPEWTIRSGEAVVDEGGRLAFYTNGVASFTATNTGYLHLWLCGTEADGRAARVLVATPTEQRSAGVSPTFSRATFGLVAAGDLVEFSYADDLVDSAGLDRNVFVGKVEYASWGPSIK